MTVDVVLFAATAHTAFTFLSFFVFFRLKIKLLLVCQPDMIFLLEKISICLPVCRASRCVSRWKRSVRDSRRCCCGSTKKRFNCDSIVDVTRFFFIQRFACELLCVPSIISIHKLCNAQFQLIEVTLCSFSQLFLFFSSHQVINGSCKRTASEKGSPAGNVPRSISQRQALSSFGRISFELIWALFLCFCVLLMR